MVGILLVSVEAQEKGKEEALWQELTTSARALNPNGDLLLHIMDSMDLCGHVAAAAASGCILKGCLYRECALSNWIF